MRALTIEVNRDTIFSQSKILVCRRLVQSADFSRNVTTESKGWIMAKVRRGLSFLGFCCVFALCSARADLYEFNNGGSIVAEGKRNNGVVMIPVAGRSFAFLESDFRRIVATEDFATALTRKLDAIKAGSVNDRLDVALWAIESGHVEEAVGLIEETARLNPADPRASRLFALLNQLRGPKYDPSTARLQSALNGEFEEIRTPNLLFLHQNNVRGARQKAEFLERIVFAFYLEFGLREVAIEIPRTRMVCVEWAKRSAYLAFLKSQNAGAFSTTNGFFHPTFRAMISYQSFLKPEAVAGPLDKKILLDPTFQDARRRTLLKTAQKLAEDLGTAAHEMVHLMVTESGLLGEPGDAPLWLHEGLAMQYEYIEGGRWAGINRVQEYRLREFRNLTKRPEVGEILDDSGFGKGYKVEAYAKAWAFVHYLRTGKPREFQEYIDRLRLPRYETEIEPGTRSVEVFRQTFGDDLRKLEAEWTEAMSKTRLAEEVEPRVVRRN